MLASIDDLAAIGALRVNEPSYDAKVTRGNRLLELVSAQVCAYLGYATEVALVAALSAVQKTALAAVVAEIAGRRINASAAPSSDFYPDGSSSLKLNRWDMRAIDDIVGSLGRGSVSITVVRDTSTSYLSVFPYRNASDFDVNP